MEDRVTAPVASRPVMDIRPQRPAPQPIQRPVVAVPEARPAVPVVSSPVQAPPAPQPTETTNNDNDFVPPPMHETPLPPKHKAPVFAIIVALLVSAALIGLTIFAYGRTQKQEPAANTASTETADPVKPEELDESVKAVEDELDTANDEADFSSSELSDESLGL